MNYNFGLRNLGQNEIHLRLHHRKILVGATLQDVLLPYLLEIVQAARVDPDVQRKNGAKAGKYFVRLPSLALLVHDVALQENPAAHGELRHGLGAKGSLRHLVHRNVEALGHALKESSVPG